MKFEDRKCSHLHSYVPEFINFENPQEEKLFYSWKGRGLSVELVRNFYIIRIKDTKADTVGEEREWLFKRIRSDHQSAHKAALRFKYENKTYKK